jgi:hypothetical protein
MLARLFTEHPASVGENYLEHMNSAGSFTGNLVLAGAACAVHALFPFLFKKTASSIISTLYDRMVVNRDRRTVPIAGETPLP